MESLSDGFPIIQKPSERLLNEFPIIQKPLERLSNEFPIIQKPSERLSNEFPIIQKPSERLSNEFPIIQKPLERLSDVFPIIQKPLERMDGVLPVVAGWQKTIPALPFLESRPLSLHPPRAPRTTGPFKPLPMKISVHQRRSAVPKNPFVPRGGGPPWFLGHSRLFSNSEGICSGSTCLRSDWTNSDFRLSQGFRGHWSLSRIARAIAA